MTTTDDVDVRMIGGRRSVLCPKCAARSRARFWDGYFSTVDNRIKA